MTETRADAIRSSFERLYQLDKMIDEIIADNVKDLRDEKGEIKARLREEFQMPAKLVSARYASYRMERAAADSSDDATLNAIREMFAALPVGGQSDFLAALQPENEPGVTDEMLEHAEAEGLADAQVGKGVETCPFPDGTQMQARWRLGWARAEQPAAAKPKRNRKKDEALAGAEAQGNA